jgi:hypothetical protein
LGWVGEVDAVRLWVLWRLDVEMGGDTDMFVVEDCRSS